MAFAGIGLFSLMQQRLAWVGERQGLLAQNIANLDTPGYVPRDAPDFATSLSQAGVSLNRTAPRHIMAAADPLHIATEAKPAEKSPDGNAVSLEDQLAKVADTDLAQQTVTQLYTAYLGMFRNALGK